MFENLYPSENNEPVSLGLAAGEETKQQKDKIAKDEKKYKDLKSSQKVYLIKILLSIGLLIFTAVLSAESLVVSGIIPGRTSKLAIVVRKTFEPAKNSKRRFYHVYWKNFNSETEQEKLLSVPYDEWATIEENQKIELVSRPFYNDWVILGASRTSGFDLAIKLSGCIFSACAIFYFLRKLKITKQEIHKIELSKFTVNF